MYFQQFYLACLAHASYMLGSEGIAAVVDPQRDVEVYLEEARRQNLTVAHVIETHLHADFVSGHKELAARTGATIHVGARAGATFTHQPAAEGSQISFGRCVLRFLETPGHTPEGVCVLVTDLDRSPEPWAVLTGDTLFIGDVGRPDLSPDYTPAQLAAMLYDSLHGKLLRLADHVEVYPAHGAGSLCGRNISSERQSTIGKERKLNYALQPMSREEFVRLLTSELPDRPGYFARDAEINRSGAPSLGELAPLPSLTPEQVAEFSAGQGAGVVLDTRPAAQFGAAHVPGSVNIPLSGQFASWAGALIGLDRPLVLVAEDPEKLAESRMRLARVGIERVAGYLEGGIPAWERAGRPLSHVPQISVHELHRELTAPNGENEKLQVIDVRKSSEWDAGHIAQAALKPLSRFALNDAAKLPELLSGLDPTLPTAVHCRSGYRSSIASSLLEKAGFQRLMNVVGGFDAWKAHALPVCVTPETPERKETASNAS